MARNRNRRGRLGALFALVPMTLLLAGSSCSDITADHPPGDVRLLWRAPLGGVDRGIHAPATDGQRLFALGGGVFAYDAATGAVVWRARYVDYMPRGLTYRDGRVFAAETVVLAFDAESGRELWRTPVDSAADFALSTADDRAFYTGTRSHRVYAFGVSDGQPLWSTDIGPDWKFGGIVSGLAASGDTLYVTAERPYAANAYIATGWLAALDRNTGRILWTYENGRGDDLRNFISPPVIAGRVLLASDLKGNAIVALDRFTGREVWRVNGTYGYIGFTDPPAVIGDTVYAASGDTYVYAIDLQTGRVLWKTTTMGANSALAVCGNKVFVNFQGLGILDRHTGRLLKTLYGFDSEFVTTGFATAQDRVFILGNKAAYAFSCG